MRLKRMLLATGGFAAVVSAVPVHAQGAEADTAEAREIIVTAQKRSERAQDIGLAISALDGDQLKELGATSLPQVANRITGVQLFDEYGGGQPTWIIRGIGLRDFNPNNTPTAAIYIDEVYQSSNVMGGVGLFDISRVEVLKGPQGALYGRNTSGGAVRVISEEPDTREFGGYIRGEYGQHDELNAEGALNLPLSDTLALRVSGRVETGGGWQTHVLSGKRWGEADRAEGRAMLLFQPSDNTKLVLKVFGGADNSETLLGQSLGAYDPAKVDLSFFDDPTDENAAAFIGSFMSAFCDDVIAGRRNSTNCLNWSSLTGTIFGSIDPHGVDEQSRNGRQTLSDPINRLDSDWWGATGIFTQEFGGATLTSVTGYEKYDFGLTFDYDGGPGIFGHQDDATDIELFQQELRLQSSGSDAFNWLVGALYSQDTLRDERSFSFPDNIFWVAFMGADPDSDFGFTQKTKSSAVFGQADYALTDRLKANIGLRYTHETKHYRGDRGFSAGLTADTTMNIVSGKVGLDFKATEDALLYASLSRGFKAGGFFGGFALESEASITPYPPERVWAYEAGFKTEWFDRRLQVNGNVFYYDYKDMQGWFTTPLFFTRLGSLGDGWLFGQELELAAYPIKGMTLNAGATHLSSRITSSDRVLFTRVGAFTGVEGSRIAGVPEWSLTALARQEVDLTDSLKGAVQLDYNYRTAIRGLDLGDVITETLMNVKGYGVLNGRVSIASEDDGWELGLAVNNIANIRYDSSRTTDDLGSFMRLPGRPRSWLLDLTWRW